MEFVYCECCTWCSSALSSSALSSSAKRENVKVIVHSHSLQSLNRHNSRTIRTTRTIHTQVRVVVKEERRAALVICEDLRTARAIQDRILQNKFARNVFLYARDDRDHSFLDKERHSGDVIVATNLAGRGTWYSSVKRENFHYIPHILQASLYHSRMYPFVLECYEIQNSRSNTGTPLSM